MHYFTYRDNHLFAEEIPVRDLAARFGTPLYLYSAATLKRHFRVVDAQFADVDHLICYAMKALSNLSILRLFARMGAGFDIVSGGELQRCLRAGADPARIVFSGVGKSDDEITAALDAGILMINVESRAELERVALLASRRRARAPISIRVNPDLDPRTHPHISTGHRESKFGVALSEIFDHYELARRLEGVEIVGLSTHIGSQITEVGPFSEAAEKLARIARELLGRGFRLRYLDLGGGLGIPYQDEALDPENYASALLKPLRALGVRLIVEPGRVLVGNAGIFVTRVLYLKDNGARRFVIVDGAMNDLIRPSLYDAYHAVWPVERRPGAPVTRTDVVGPVCESGDFFARDRELPEPVPGDLLAVMSAGAYGFVMASNYNSRPRAAEVLVDGHKAHLIRERESFDDLVRGERLVDIDPYSAVAE